MSFEVLSREQKGVEKPKMVCTFLSAAVIGTPISSSK